MGLNQEEKIQLPTESYDSEIETNTPPLTDGEESPDEPRKICKVGDLALVKVAGKRPNVYQKFVAVVAMVKADGDLLVSFL